MKGLRTGNIDGQSGTGGDRDGQGGEGDESGLERFGEHLGQVNGC